MVGEPTTILPDDLDPGIAEIVQILHAAGIETYESCQGGPGHNGGAGEWPVVRFHGTQADGFRALSVAMTYDLPVYELQRFWSVLDREPTGPHWQLVFHPGWLARFLEARHGRD